MAKSNLIDYYSRTANMYGCEPCPKCGSVWRCIFNDVPDQIKCDECGLIEKIASSSEEEK